MNSITPNWSVYFYILLSYLLPIFGIIATVTLLYILNKIARELKRMNDEKKP